MIINSIAVSNVMDEEIVKDLDVPLVHLHRSLYMFHSESVYYLIIKLPWLIVAHHPQPSVLLEGMEGYCLEFTLC